MAGELSQEEVLDFLCQGGGRVTNAALLGHFKRFLRDPQAPEEQLLKRRERFKRYVNSVAVVRQEGAVKYVVLRSRYRDLLGEEIRPEEPVQCGQETPQVGGGGWVGQAGEASGHSNGHAHRTDCGYTESALATSITPTCSGNGDEKSCRDALYSESLQQQSPQLVSPRSSDQESTRTCPIASSAPRQLSHNAYSHESNKSSLSSNTSPQQHFNIFMSPTMTSLSGNSANISLVKTSETTFMTSLPSAQNVSPQIASTLFIKPTEPCVDASTFFIKTSEPLIDSIASSNNTLPTNHAKESSSPGNASITSSNISLPNTASMHSSKSSGPQVYNSVPFLKDSFSPSNASMPSSKTSSPTNASMISSRSTGLQSNAHLRFKNDSSPSNASMLSSKTPSPSNGSVISGKSPGLQSNDSYPLTKNSSSCSEASMPFSKASEPRNNICSSFSNDYFITSNHSAVSMESSFCSSKSSPLPESPLSGVSQPWRLPPKGEGITEYSNPAFVSATSRDLVQEHSNGFCEVLVASPTSQQYENCTLPSPFQSGFSSPDVLLAEDPPTSPSPPLALNDMHGMWMYDMPVFKSIRCQLSLQDMEDFVDQESCASEGSDSGEGGDCDTEHKDDDDPSSDSYTEKYVQVIEQKCENTRRCPPNRKFLSIIDQYSKLQSEDLLEAKETLLEFVENGPSIDPGTRKSPYVAKSFLTDQAPVMFELARQPPKHRMSSRFRELMSSSDDELIDRDYKKRRRPSRTKRPNILVSPQPDVDMLLTVKPVTCNQFIANNIADQKVSQAQYAPNMIMNPPFKKPPNFKQSSVPLDSLEHDWIIKLASGSWLQVYGLFIEDPQLAFRKDFISGYTALHWFAKHGAVEMFHKFVNGAKKEGIELDFNIKSNGGYTPLHIAAIHGHHKLATMLVEKLRANVKLRDNSGKRAWQYLSCNTSGDVWQLLGAPKGKTIFASRALNVPYSLNTQSKSTHISRKTSLAAFLKPQHQKWKDKKHPVLREREVYSD